MEEAAGEKPVAEAYAAERPRSYHDARRKLPEDGRHAQHGGERAAKPRREDYDSDLEHEEHHLLDSRKAKVGIRRLNTIMAGQNTGRRHGGGYEEKPLSLFHVCR